jgi:fumarate reductase (CoM/CoB) subunit A
MSNISHEFIECHVLVIGAGAAGIRAAIAAAKYGATVILSKTIVGKGGCSVMAEGGINAVLNPNDSFARHIDDTLQAGAFLNAKDQATTLVKQAPKRVMELLKWGAIFNSTAQETLAQRPFGGQQFPRTCYAEDRTGHEIMATLTEQLRSTPAISIYHSTTAIALLKHRNTIAGAITVDWQGKMQVFIANSTILATGGGAQVYDVTTNSFGSTGDGYALAFAANVELIDMEMVQFHPTSMVFPYYARGRLVTEAMRSEGGVLYNKLKTRFMQHYCPGKMELAARDILSRAIVNEITAGRGTPHDGVYLDVSHLAKATIVSKFPTMLEQFLNLGIDIRNDPVEVAPAAHHIMGGIKITATDCQSTVPYLFACGEVVGGTHGANRLGGNGLLETQVFGRIAGIAAGKTKTRKLTIDPKQIIQQKRRLNAFLDGDIYPAKVAKTIKQLMWQNAGIFRNAAGLNKALRTLQELAKLKLKATTAYNFTECYAVQNMCCTAMLICKAALLRTESRGAHMRIDATQVRNKNNTVFGHTYISKLRADIEKLEKYYETN